MDSTDNANQVGYLGTLRIKNSQTAAFGNDVYTPWTTDSGIYYLGYDVVNTADTLWFRNYTVTCTGERFEVKPRLIKPVIVGEYTYNYGDVIHDGKYSTPITPVFDFGTITKDSTQYNTCKENIEFTYNGSTEAYSDAGENLIVSLRITNGNYRFDESGVKTTTCTYTINKLRVDIAWNPPILNVRENETYRECLINEFDEQFMTVVSLMHPVVGENGNTTNVEIVKGEGAGKYQIVKSGDVRKLSFTPDADGSYTLTVRLKSTNYILNGEESTTADITLTLQVTNSNGVIIVTLGDQSWEYDPSVDGLTNNVSATYNNNVVAFTESFAKVDLTKDSAAAIMQELDGKGYAFNEYDEKAADYLSGLGANTFGSHAQVYNLNAGTYVLRLQYSGHYGYCVFTVTPKEITLPEFDDWVNPAYDGNWHEQDVILVDANADLRNAISVTATCSVTQTSNGYVLRARNKADYTVTFAPISGNYVFADGTDATRTWKITTGTNKVTFANASETFTYDGRNTYLINVSADFGGNISYSYKPQGNASADWISGKPINAGTYILKAESTANGDIYTSDAATITLVIEKATLFATPSGSVVYGNAFDENGGYGYTVTGFVNGQTSAGVEPTMDNVKYTLTDASGNSVTGLPAVGVVYRLGLKLNGETVDGVEYANYVVKLTLGTFTVTPRPVTVTVPARSSVYGDGIDLLWDGVTVKDAQGNTSFGTLDYSAVLGFIELQIEDDLGNKYPHGSTPNANRYVYSAVCKTGSESEYANFDVSFAYAQYTVNRRQISIKDVKITEGNVDTVQATRVNSLNNAGNSEISILQSLVYTYSGANVTGGSTTVFENVKKVGSYTVTVTIGSAYANNYELTGITSYSFTVSKRSLISEDIVIESQVYTGGALVPKVTYKGYDEERFDELFIVTYGDWKNVGTYSVLVTIRNSHIDDYQWTKTSEATQMAEFEITPAKNKVTEFSVAGWVYDNGKTVPKPKISTTFDPDGSRDTYEYTYINAATGLALDGYPTQAGLYSVQYRITSATNNYEYDPSGSVLMTTFTISKAVVGAPTLVIIGEGEGKNDVYTGGTLQANVSGFDSTIMDVIYDGVSNLSGGNLYVQAVNAGAYNVTLKLKDGANYAWGASDGLDSDGNVSLGWTVAKQKVARPFDSGKKMIVNGKILEYVPTGFDESIMSITDNLTGYGGTFTAKVDLKDTDNYEWEDGSTETVLITWEVIGSNTVFAIVVGTLSGMAGVLGIAAAIMYVKLRKKQRMEAEVAKQ